MVQIDVSYQGGLRTVATHGPSGATLTTDAPVDNQGRGEAFSPTDLVATALGSCMLTLMGIVAERHDYDLEGATARVRKHMASTPTRRIARLEVVLHVPVDPGEKGRERLRRAAETCPVKKSLPDELEVPVRYVFGADVAAEA